MGHLEVRRITIQSCINNHLCHQSCLSSTVHQVVGLGLSEMIKICRNSSSPTNWWVGPGLVTAAEAVKPAVNQLSPGLVVTLWDKLEIQGDRSTTLQDFLDMMKKKYQLEVISPNKMKIHCQYLEGYHGGAGLPHGVRAHHARA